MFPPQPDPVEAQSATSVVPAQLPMAEEQVRKFRLQIDLALKSRKEQEPWWEANLKAYAPQVNQNPNKWAEDINTNRDFTLVERKKADLYYQTAEMTLQPSPLMDGPLMAPDPVTGQPAPMMGPPDANGQAQPIQQSAALQAHQEIVNELRGPDGIDAKRMIHQALFDVLNTCGKGFTKLGYEQHASMQPVKDPLTGEMRLIPVPVKRTVFWHYFPPKQGLIPAGFRSTEWDRAPWLGYQFELPLTKANREKYHLPEDFQGSKPDSTQHFDHGIGVPDSDRVFTGVELEYRSVLYREDIVHPDHLTLLVLVDGVDEPVIHQDSPHQTLDETGSLTPDSLIGYSIHPLNVRTMTDSANPPSDSTMIRPLVNELNIYRTQCVQFRDATTLKWGYRLTAIPPEAMAKIVRSPIGGMVGLPDEAFPIDQNIVELPQGSIPRESFLGQQAIDDDIARTSGIDASGAGVQSSANQTATEAQIQQGNANARLDFERGVVLDWDIKGVTKFSTLLCRYLPVEDAVKIVGQARAQVWDVWRKQAASSLAFTALPDSALRTDQAADRKRSMDEYTYFANDPYVNREYLIKKLATKLHYDPSQFVKTPDPPKPEPPKLAFSFKGEDLVGPQAVIVLGIAEQLGIKIDPSWVTLAQAALQQSMELAAQADAQNIAAKADGKHGGKVAQMESLSKHAVDMTGNMQGIGQPAASGAGGGIM